MAILDIYTKNPEISWVIKKNPNTQKETGKPFSRVMRKGNVFGWYRDNESFRLFFKDGNGESSFYKHLNNNYLNQSAYNCPYVYCSIIGEMLSVTARSQHEKDIDCENSIELSSIQITLPNVAQFFIKYFSEKVKIEMTLLAKKVYSVKFHGKISLFYLTNLVQVFCLMQAIEDKNIYIDMTEGGLNKYAQALNNISAPYFIVYLFISRCIPDNESFEKIQNVLQQKNWLLHFGNTQKQRFDQIKKYIQGGIVLHDIGCGELYYTRQFSSNYEKVIAWDMDQVIQERNQKFIERKKINNVQLNHGFQAINVDEIKENHDILITEMLEHMPKENAKEILLSIKESPFRRLIITLPNGEFNQFYKLDGEFRHEDHYWEPTYQETIMFIEEVFGKENPKVEIKPIGDGIENIHISTLIIVTK